MQRQDRYSIGLDFGTESGRAVLVNVTTGEEVASAVHVYHDGVIDTHLPNGSTKLGADWALQNPMDYLQVLNKAIPEVLEKSGVSADQVIGIGVDFTSCTVLPVLADGTPLSMMEEWRDNPHAWTKLWKHHSAQPEADQISEAAEDEGWIEWYGGKVSSEWLHSKALEILNDAPEVFHATDLIVEAGDWVVWQLTGKPARNACAAGYKGLWDAEQGDLDTEFLERLHPEFGAMSDKLIAEVLPPGTFAGSLSREGSRLTGLPESTAVAIATIDAHAAVAGAGVTEPGRMVIVMGTSSCHMMLDEEAHLIPGISGVVKDGILPGFYGYEAGQAGVGDVIEWFVERGSPKSYHDDAKSKLLTVYQVLEMEAAKLKPGESGLLALDWWNGNRSTLVDAELSGMLVGYTTQTTGADIYRAILEATAFGTRVIIDQFEEHGVTISDIVASGGLAAKNKLMMQIYADVTGRTIRVAMSDYASALGAAMFGAVAATSDAGGYDSITSAARAMAKYRSEVYTPNPDAQEIYDELYEEYLLLYDYFGRGENDVMKRLRAIKRDQRS